MPYADPEIRKQKAREFSQKNYQKKKLSMEQAGHVFRVPMTEDERKVHYKKYFSEWNKRDRIENPERQRAVLKRSREKHYEKRLAGNRKWTMENPEKQQNIRRRSRYGITSEIYDQMVLDQNGLCAICQEEHPLAIDHCHDTGKVRGLLCKKCNSGIGLLRDSAAVVENALAYLRKF